MKYTLLLKLAMAFLLLVNCGFSQAQKMHFDNKSYVSGEFLIQLLANEKIEDVLKNAPAEFELRTKQFISPPMQIWLLEFNPNIVSHESMQRWLYGQKSVVTVDYNYHVQVRETMPGDPSVNQQWHHKNTGQTGGTNDADIDSDLAWDITTGGQTATGVDIVVCMVEGSGGNLNHQDLSPNRWINVNEIPDNGIDDDNNGFIDDYYGWNSANNTDDTGTGGHGTNCLGMIGAKGDNGLNVVGANWDVKLMVVNMANSLTQANVIAAYTYPFVMRKMWNETNGEKGAFVVATSASWGIDQGNPANYPLWCNFYDSLGYQGVINIGATTNSNLNVDQVGDMPTACSSDYMIGVGRTDHNDNTAGGYGITTIDFGAPGIDVVTTNGTSGITTTTGTSFACPLTAGVVGLAYSIPCPNFMSIVTSNPRLGADLVLQALIDGVDVKTQLASKFITGGRLNSKNTLDLLMTETCSDCYVQSVASTTTEDAATITFSASAEVATNNIFWRKVGENTWQSANGIASPYTIEDLETCSNYEFQIQSICSSEDVYSSIMNFATSGCGNCVDLTYCESKATGSNQARVAYKLSNGTSASTTTLTLTSGWGADVDEDYNYGNFVLMNGTGTANEGCGTISNAGALSGNIAVAVRGTCNFTEKAISAQNAGATALVIINTGGTLAQLGAGTGSNAVTIPVVMISQAQGANLLADLSNGGEVVGIVGVQDQWLQTVSINGVTNVSGDNNGYLAADATSPFALTQGETYPVSILAGFGNQTIPSFVNIWLDVNQNGNFETNELIATNQSDASQAIPSILIPANTVLGSTRLRIQSVFNGFDANNQISACEEYVWGEVEDYCVMIAEADPSASISSVDAALWLVYPNPVQDRIYFSFKNNSQSLKIQITNLVGQEIHQERISGESTSIDVQSFAPGTYLYTVIDDNNQKMKTGKFLIHK